MEKSFISVLPAIEEICTVLLAAPKKEENKLLKKLEQNITQPLKLLERQQRGSADLRKNRGPRKKKVTDQGSPTGVTSSKTPSATELLKGSVSFSQSSRKSKFQINHCKTCGKLAKRVVPLAIYLKRLQSKKVRSKRA